MEPDQNIVFVDESSFCSASSSTKVYELIGQSPVLKEVNSVTERVYAISGITPRGELFSEVYRSAISTKQVIDFLKLCLNKMEGQLNIIWDNASIHKSKELKHFLRSDSQARDRLQLYSTPVYCPEYNPDEQVWNFLKSEFLKHRWCKTKSQLQKTVEAGLEYLAMMPDRIRAAFRHSDVKIMEY